MTEAELQLDLDLCGSEMMLVVARFDIKDNTNQDATLEDLAMDWNDIGAGAPSRSRKKVVCFEDEESYENSYELKTHSNFNAVMNTSSQDHLEIHDGDDDPSEEEESVTVDNGPDGTEDTSRPRGRPSTKQKAEDGTEDTPRPRGRPANTKTPKRPLVKVSTKTKQTSHGTKKETNT